jgi:hypothetical protein
MTAFSRNLKRSRADELADQQEQKKAPEKQNVFSREPVIYTVLTAEPVPARPTCLLHSLLPSLKASKTS